MGLFPVSKQKQQQEKKERERGGNKKRLLKRGDARDYSELFLRGKAFTLKEGRRRGMRLGKGGPV